jgi:hypothetical protein
MKTKHTALAAAAAMLLFSSGAQAGLTITWGGSADSIGLASDAVSGWDSSYEFLLGTMGSGYNSADPNTWVASFTTLDTATYTPNGIAPNEGYFVGSYTVASNTQLAANTQLYMWVRKGTTTNPGTEWLLVTDDDTGAGGWIVPTIAQDQTDRAVSYSLVCDGSNGHDLVFGGLGGSVNQQLGGDYTAPTTGSPSTWCYQTHTFPIPEPTSLGLLAAAALIRRRRRA